MTRYQLARLAVKAYPRHALAHRRNTNYLRRRWISAVEYLGDGWLLARANWIKKTAREAA